MDGTATVITFGIELIALAAAVGVVASTLWVFPRDNAAEHAHTLLPVRRALWKLLGLSLIILTLTSAAGLLLRTASMSELPVMQAFPALPTVLFKTQYGSLWLWRSGALLLLWLAWALHWRKLDGRLIPALVFLALTLIAFALSASGHAGDDGLFTFVSFANTLHILGAMLWGGGIIAMTLHILTRLLRGDNNTRTLIAHSSLRLSTLATVALIITLLPGIYHAWLQIGSWPALWETRYGQILLAKIFFVGAMMLLGALHRYISVPAVQRHAQQPEPATLIPVPQWLRRGDDTHAPRHFLRSLRAEMTLLLIVLALAAVLSQQTPAIHMEHEAAMEHGE